MNKKFLFFLAIIFLLFLTLFIYTVPAYAGYTGYGISASEISPNDKSSASNSIGKTVGAAINIVRIVAVAVAVIMLIVLAIKYISSAPNERSEIKKHATVYFIGAIVLFSISGILQIIQSFSKLIY